MGFTKNKQGSEYVIVFTSGRMHLECHTKLPLDTLHVLGFDAFVSVRGEDHGA